MSGALDGRRIVVPESRELELFTAMLEREGAETIRCPLVRILDVEDPAPVDAWLRRLCAGAFDDLILYTGEGVQRLAAFATAAGLDAEFVAALGRARKLVRGPKPVRVLRTLGLSADIQAEPATSAGLLEALAALDVRGRRIGIQAYPGLPDAIDRTLAEAGATTERVLPYRYADDREDGRVVEVIDRMAADEVDLIAFTSRPQVDRLRDVALRAGRQPALDTAIARIPIAAIGPVTTDAVLRAGWTVAVAPAKNFHLKPLVRAVCALIIAPAPRCE